MFLWMKFLLVEAVPPHEEGNVKEQIPELDPELLTALGEAIQERPAYGKKIPKLGLATASRLKKRLNNLKEYAIPENFKLLRASSLKTEISSAVSGTFSGFDIKRLKPVNNN